MGITLKFTETNLFLIKLDYLYSVWVLLLTRLGHSQLKKLIKVSFSYTEDNKASAICPQDN